MSKGINKVTLIGNLGADPEVRYTANGKPIANVSIATSDTWLDKESGEKRTQTEWHRVIFFGGLAGVVEKHLKKGAKIYLEGKLRTRKWTDKQDRENYTTEVIADEMLMLDSRVETKENATDL